MKNTEWLHDAEWRFLIQIGNNEYSISGIIPRCKNLQTARNQIRPEIYQFVNELIESAQNETLDIPQPNPQPPRKKFDAGWRLEIKGKLIGMSIKIQRYTVLDCLIAIKKDIRGKI